MKLKLSDRREAWRIFCSYSPEMRRQEIMRELKISVPLLAIMLSVIIMVGIKSNAPLGVMATIAGGVTLFIGLMFWGGLMFCPLVEALEAHTLRERQTGPTIPAAPSFDC